MIGLLANFWKTWLLRAEVVHRLPGRLRLRIPALRMVDGAQEDWAFLWRGLPDDVDGIEEVEVTPTSGSVLIRYRPEQLTEAELLDFLAALNRVVLQHWDRLAASPPAERAAAIRQLAQAIRAGIKRRLVLDGDIGLEANV
jgi:hypothetical protein